jgi:hypothetical protein
MNFNSVEFKFGFLLGAVKDNADMNFDNYIYACNEYIDKFDITEEMLEVIMSQYCSDYNFVGDTGIIKLGDWHIIGAVYFDKEQQVIKEVKLCEECEKPIEDGTWMRSEMCDCQDEEYKCDKCDIKFKYNSECFKTAFITDDETYCKECKDRLDELDEQSDEEFTIEGAIFE